MFGRSFGSTVSLLNEIKFAASFGLEFRKANEKRKLDPHTPALRSKGEKARNRSLINRK